MTSPPQNPSGPGAALRALSLILAGIFPALFLFVAASRMRFPFELEWMEGTSLEAVSRLLSGRALYVRPTLDFAPQFYTPFYHYVSWAFARAAGLGFAPLRLVSIVSVIGSLAILLLHVRRETGNARAGWMAACLYAAYYGATAGWYDLARVDSLFILLMLGGIYALRFGVPAAPRGESRSMAGPASWAAAALLITLAYFTKQIALIVFIPASAGVLLAEPKRGLITGALTTVFLAVLTVSCETLHHGWYLYYVQKLPVAQPTDVAFVTRFWFRDIPRFSPVAFAAAVVVLRRLKSDGDRKAFWFYGALGFGAVMSAWMARLNVGGDINSLMPMHAVLALFFGIAFARFEAWAARPAGESGTRELKCALIAAFVAQFALLAYNPMRFIPGPEDRAAWDALKQQISSTPGRVLVPFHPWLTRAAGKRPHAHTIALADVIRGDPEGEGKRVRSEMIAELNARRYDAIFSGGPEGYFKDDVEANYERSGALFELWPGVYPRSGHPIRPKWLYVPRAPQAPQNRSAEN